MSLNFSNAVKELIIGMTTTAEAFELKEINSIVLLDEFIGDRDFANSLCKATSYNIDFINDLMANFLDSYSPEAEASQEDCDEALPFSDDLKDVFYYAELIAKEENREELSLEDLVFSLLSNQSSDVKAFFTKINANTEQIKRYYTESIRIEKNKWTIPSILTGCVEVLNDKFKVNSDCAILGRDKECQEIWKTMMKKTKRNVLLIGEPGVGKSSIVYKLTCDIINGTCPKMFKNFQIISLNVNNLIAGTTLRGQAEERYKDLINFMQNNKNVILFIDEIHMIVGAGANFNEVGKDFSNALKPILAGDDAIVIGATTNEEYNQTIGMQGALRRRFRTITVNEPKTTEVYGILKDSIKQLEAFHGVTISKKMVDLIIFYSSCFNYDTKNPDRTKDLIDLSMVTAKFDGKKYVDRRSIMKNFDVNFEKFHKMPINMIRETAYHEIGHYVVNRLSSYLTDTEVIAVSIIPTNTYLGVNVLDRTDTFASHDKNFFIDKIAALLAGRISERIFTNSKYNAGACSDLERANKIAYDMVTKYGMATRLGEHRVYFNDNNYQMQALQKTTDINVEISQIISDASERAEKLLRSNEEVIHKLVDEISRKGMLNHIELNKIVQDYLNAQEVAQQS